MQRKAFHQLRHFINQV